MINESEIREAVENEKSMLCPNECECPVCHEKKILINIVEAYLNVEGLPKKLEQGQLLAGVDITSKEYDLVIEWVNKYIDRCKVVIAKDYVKRSKFKSLQKLYKRVDKSSNIMAKQISLMSDGVPYDEAVKE